MRRPAPAWTVTMSKPLHRWIPADARTARCQTCGLTARGEHDARRAAYSVWRWRNLMWDSRESAPPTCPPTYSAERGIAPRVMVKPE